MVYIPNEQAREWYERRYGSSAGSRPKGITKTTTVTKRPAVKTWEERKREEARREWAQRRMDREQQMEELRTRGAGMGQSPKSQRHGIIRKPDKWDASKYWANVPNEEAQRWLRTRYPEYQEDVTLNTLEKPQIKSIHKPVKPTVYFPTPALPPGFEPQWPDWVAEAGAGGGGGGYAPQQSYAPRYRGGGSSGYQRPARIVPMQGENRGGYIGPGQTQGNYGPRYVTGRVNPQQWLHKLTRLRIGD